MQQRDLDDADRVHRLAFGTRFGVPDPSQFRGDAEFVRTRWATDPSTTFVAEQDGTIVGAGIGMDWGSVFVVGPIVVHPSPRPHRPPPWPNAAPSRARSSTAWI